MFGSFIIKFLGPLRLFSLWRYFSGQLSIPLHSFPLLWSWQSYILLWSCFFVFLVLSVFPCLPVNLTQFPRVSDYCIQFICCLVNYLISSYVYILLVFLQSLSCLCQCRGLFWSQSYCQLKTVSWYIHLRALLVYNNPWQKQQWILFLYSHIILILMWLKIYII